MEDRFPSTAVANVYARCPTASRDLLASTCTIDGYLISDERRILATGARPLIGQNVALDLTISAVVFLFR